jgi:nucleoid DNA-binding protein
MATDSHSIGIRELAVFLADKHDLTKARAKAIVDDLRDRMVESILADKMVGLFGLGHFQIKVTKPREGMNPKTGEKIHIPSKRRVAFKASKTIKDKL